MRWAERQRIDWIAKTLQDLGYINRSHLIIKFEISKPQAAHDLKVFQELNPGVIKYDVSAKRYVSTTKIKENSNDNKA